MTQNKYAEIYDMNTINNLQKAYRMEQDKVDRLQQENERLKKEMDTVIADKGTNSIVTLWRESEDDCRVWKETAEQLQAELDNSIPKSKIEGLIKERTYGFSGYQKGRRVEGGVILVSDLQALLTEDTKWYSTSGIKEC